MITLNMVAGSAAAAYEELRSHMLAGSPGGPHFGTVVLLREGIAAWIERRISGPEPAPAATTQPPRPLLSDRLRNEIINVLADIALDSREEMKP